MQKFQSTLPAWGATLLVVWTLGVQEISIHAPRMGSDDYIDNTDQVEDISIHAPRMGSDCMRISKQYAKNVFQSTLPAWGATKTKFIEEGGITISIHAPRMGSDLRCQPLP